MAGSAGGRLELYVASVVNREIVLPNMLLPARITVVFERREEGGLRAFSDDVPGFVLSHSDPMAVLRDIKPALEGILSHQFGAPVLVE